MATITSLSVPSNAFVNIHYNPKRRNARPNAFLRESIVADVTMRSVRKPTRFVVLPKGRKTGTASGIRVYRGFNGESVMVFNRDVTDKAKEAAKKSA